MGRRVAGRFDAIGIGVAALVFYLLTLAPTVLWGDDAELQRLAATSGRINPGRGHLLWLAVARAMQLLPWGNPAWKANAVSALFGALTVGLILAATRRLTENRLAALVAALSLAVSHLFWLHSVRAEVYTLHTAVVATIVWLAVLWTRNPGSGRLAFLLGFVPGLGAINHVLVATLLPAIGWLLRPRRGRLTWRPIATAAGGLALGLIPWILLEARAAIGDPFRRPFESFAPLSVTGGEIVKGLLCILYQFPLTLPFAVAGIAALALDRSPLAGFLALGIAGAVGFAASFHVADQIVFYLPASPLIAVAVGAGVARVAAATAPPGVPGPRAREWLRAAGLILAGVVAPVVLYAAAPALLQAAGSGLPELRPLPGRGAAFFLWPPKNGYEGARRFADGCFAVLPERALILADWTPAEPLLYVQEVEGRRRDVTVRQLGAGWRKQAPFLVRESRERPVYLASTGPYYDMAEIRSHFRVTPDGPVYRLDPREP